MTGGDNTQAASARFMQTPKGRKGFVGLVEPRASMARQRNLEKNPQTGALKILNFRTEMKSSQSPGVMVHIPAGLARVPLPTVSCILSAWTWLSKNR